MSTDEQAVSGAGTAAQRSVLLGEAERRGWHVVGVLEDAGYSAKDLKRPAIQEAMEMLKRGDADALVVSKIDRLARSMLDFAGLMATAQKQHWALVSLDCGVDTTSPAGEAMSNVLATFAQFERRLISQRTKDALAVKRTQGVRLGRPQQLSLSVVRRICEASTAGTSLTAIAKALNEDRVATAQGGAEWYASTIKSVLSSQAAAGVLS